MKNEKTNLLCRKVKQLNLVINEFSKENHEREKQTIAIQKKSEKQLDIIFTNYQTKIQKMMKSFFGQQKYFIDLFRPRFEDKVIEMKSQFVQVCKSTTECFDKFQLQVNELVNEVNNLSIQIFNLIMNEDIIFEQVANSLMFKIDCLNNHHLSDLQKLDESNRERIAKYQKSMSFLSNPEITNISKKALIQNYLTCQAKDMKSKITKLKQQISNIKKEFTTIISDQKVQLMNKRKQLNQIISEYSQSYIENEKRKAKERSNMPESVIHKIRSNTDIEKIVFSYPKEDKKLKTVLSANSVFEFKMTVNNEIKELQYALNEVRQNNQREIFETQFQYSEEKKCYLKNFSELLSIVKLSIENQELAKRLDNQYKEAQMKKKIEIEKVKNQLEKEFFEKKEKIESKSNRVLIQKPKSGNLFETERKRYEQEFHELSSKLTPQTQDERKKAILYDLISHFLNEIEFENRRHSLQMLLFDLMRSSRIAIKAATSNATNTVNLLREAIKRQIEINKQSYMNSTITADKLTINRHSSMSSIEPEESAENSFVMEKNRIALRAIRTSESNRTNSLNFQRELDRRRVELLTFYDAKIKEIQFQKNLVKKEISDFNEGITKKSNAIKFKLFSMVETYQQLRNSEFDSREKIIEKINLKFDGQIERLQKSIELMKNSNGAPNKAPSSIEAKIGKMNWHCELLNSQLAALTKQLRNAQRSSKNPDQLARVQKRVKSSIQVSPLPYTNH